MGCLAVYTAIENYLNNVEIELPLLYILGYVLLIPIVNLIFYSILKKKCHFGADVFLYGIGFTSASVTLLIAASAIDILHGLLISPYVWAFYAIPLVSLFYSCSILPKINEKGMKEIILCLVIIAVVFLIIGIIKDFEALKETGYYNLLPIFLLIIFGLYMGYYAIYRTIRLSPRNLAWAPVLILFSCIMILVFAIGIVQIGYTVSLPESATVAIVAALAVIVIPPFTISCLISGTLKYLTKKKRKNENSE